MNTALLPLVIRAFASAVETQAERMHKLGEAALFVRSQLNSEQEFRDWLDHWAPQVAHDHELLNDSILYAEECAIEKSFSA